LPDTNSNSAAITIPPISLRRRAMDRLMTGVAALTVVLVLLPLGAIFAYLIYKGAGSINWAFLTQTPKPVGEPGGGMANAIVGSMVILAIASLMGVPFGIGAGIYLSEYGRNRYGDIVRFVSDVLNGVPSIVIGIVAYSLVVLRQGHFSALAGGVALAIMMVPTIARFALRPPASSRASCWLSRASPEKPPRCCSRLLETSSGTGKRTSRRQPYRCRFSPTPFHPSTNGISRLGRGHWF
jgi:hypothetical protein